MDAQLSKYKGIIENKNHIENDSTQSFLQLNDASTSFPSVNNQNQNNQSNLKSESNNQNFQFNNSRFAQMGNQAPHNDKKQDKPQEAVFQQSFLANTQGQMQNFNQLQPQIMNHSQDNFPSISPFESKILNRKLDFTSSENSPLCLRREGMLKIRDIDQKDKDVVVTFAVLTRDRLSYFVNAKDETSIQGSIELDKIKENLKLINGFPSCFTIKTLDSVSDCSVCAESEDSAREWINAITQNAVNCNTISALNNLNKRGLLK